MIRLSLPSGVIAAIHPRGATLHELWVPDREGLLDDILLGPEQPGTGPRMFMGATVGRYANRIGGAASALDGVIHRLLPSDGPNCLHGGPDGFDQRDWLVEDHAASTATLSLISPNGDQGFPGEMRVRVTYALSDGETGARLDIELTATTDAATPISLTNHAYFNLGGTSEPAEVRTIDDHLLTVAASAFVPVTPDAIPLPSAPAPVAGTVFDLQHGALLGERLRYADPQLAGVRGIDHCFALDGEGFRHAATLDHPASGRVMELWTDQPGLQVYTGNWLDGTMRGKNGGTYRMGDAICLEPGAYPDAPNRPDFPPAILRPGETYRHHMALVFPRP